MQKGKPKNQAEKELLMHEYLSSGKEKMAWCKEKGIPYNTFYKWLRDYESKDTNEPKFIDLSKITSKDSESVTKLTSPESIDKSDKSCLTLEIKDCKLTVLNCTDIKLLTKVIKAVRLSDV